MARYRLDIEYDGTRYSGWQLQKDARTIQGELIRAAFITFETRELDIQGAGRTDAGVHALQQVAHIEVETKLTPVNIRYKMNDDLPPDINILDVKKTYASFHARHDALARSYLYQISSRRTAFGKKYVWWIKDKLDIGKMNAAIRLVKGMKDFQSFVDKNNPEGSTKVLIEEVELIARGNLILFRICGSHFLWKMVRRLVGVVVEIGRGTITVKDMENYLIENSDDPAVFTAPPSGLFLERIYYQGETRLKDIHPIIQL